MGLIIENGLIEILYGSLLAFWIIYLYFVKDYGYWEQRNVPHVPAVFPFGSLGKMVLGKCYWGTAYDMIYRDFKDEPFVGFIEVRSPCLLIKNTKFIKCILKDDFHNFMDHVFVDVHPKDYLVQHLYNMKGQKWKEMREKLTPAYTVAKMKMMFGLVKECSDVFREHVRKMTDKNHVIDVKDVLTRFTLDVVATCAFGIETNSLSNESSEFYQVGKKIMTMSVRDLLKMYGYSAFPSVFKTFHCFDFLDPKIKNCLTDIIRMTVEYREKHISRCDFLDLFIKLRQNKSILEEGEKPVDFSNTPNNKKEGLTIEEITAETFLFLFSGYELTAITALFSLYELACNSEIQNILYREVRDVLDRHGDISYQALEDMTYMDQVINESIRRYPALPFLLRTCTENYRIPDSSVIVEKGMKVIIPVYSLHHDPQYFPDPDIFDPERFSPENCRNRNPFVFLPFGEGPRMCIAFRFGLMKVKTALATLISDYEVCLTPDTEVPLQFKSNAYVTLPAKPLMLALTKRNK